MPVLIQESNLGAIPLSTIILDRAPVNVLDFTLIEELSGAIQKVKSAGARVVVLRGNGRCFSAGVDVAQHTPEMMPKLLPAFHRVFRELMELDAVLIAALHGSALGGAAEIALACDRVIAEENTKFGLPEIGLGCYPPVAVALLARRIGAGRAAGMILGGKLVPVEKLKEWGLVDRVAPTGELGLTLKRELAQFEDKSPGVLGITAGLLHRESWATWGPRLAEVEAHYLRDLLPHPDVAEGVRAFAEKRDPVWQAEDGSRNGA